MPRCAHTVVHRIPRVVSHARLALLALLVAAAWSGCARDDRNESAPQGESVLRVGPSDTTRQGRTFVATYEDGPVDQLRVVRDTAGGIVVEGGTGFPDGTEISIALLASGGPDGARRRETVAATRAIVELGRFQGQPLLTANGPLPAGPVAIRLLASFAPGRQSDAVLHATAHGQRFRGSGMRLSPDGYAVYESTVEANL